MKYRLGNRDIRAFSLVEVLFSMAVASLCLMSLLWALTEAFKDGAVSADETAIGAIFEDIHDRIEGATLQEGPVSVSPLFYDQRGVYYREAESNRKTESIDTEKFFRVEVSLSKPVGDDSSLFTESLFAVNVDIFWPLDEDGAPLPGKEPGNSATYFTSAKTGPAWEVIDSDYKPKIEY